MIQPVPVPEVYLYCSTPDNPVRAEWIIIPATIHCET
jgi:hypothetical protein